MTGEGEDPRTVEQWREAVIGACFMIELESARLYGFITGGPETNMRRCDEILGRARQELPPDQWPTPDEIVAGRNAMITEIFEGRWSR